MPQKPAADPRVSLAAEGQVKRSLERRCHDLRVVGFGLGEADGRREHCPLAVQAGRGLKTMSKKKLVLGHGYSNRGKEMH